MDGGFNGDTVCRRRPYNRVILGVWFTKIYPGEDIFRQTAHSVFSKNRETPPPSSAYYFAKEMQGLIYC